MKVRRAGFCLLFLGLAMPALSSSKFTPPPGKVILFVGQDQTEIAAYMKSVSVHPAGFMAYTSLNLEGLETPYDEGGGLQNAQSLMDDYPPAVLQIGLYLVDSLPEIVNGNDNEPIDRLARWMKAARRPIFLRIGYEFDLPGNRYDPKLYVSSFRHIVDRFRRDGVNNVAFVWHSCAQSDATHIMDWYPGDDYVDWVGLSYFGQFPKFVNQVAEVAHKLNKPLMLAETSPWYRKSPEQKKLWFKRLFEFIDTRGVSALCYINCDWDALEAYRSQGFGNTRVQQSPELQRLWTDEISRDTYLKSSKDVYDQVGFKP